MKMTGQENGVDAVFNSRVLGVLGTIPSVIPSVNSLICSI